MKIEIEIEPATLKTVVLNQVNDQIEEHVSHFVTYEMGQFIRDTVLKKTPPAVKRILASGKVMAVIEEEVRKAVTINIVRKLRSPSNKTDRDRS